MSGSSDGKVFVLVFSPPRPLPPYRAVATLQTPPLPASEGSALFFFPTYTKVPCALSIVQATVSSPEKPLQNPRGGEAWG